MINSLLLVVIAAAADFMGAVLALGPLRFSHRALLYLLGMSGGYLISWSVADLMPLLVQHSPSLVILILVGYFGLYLIENLFASHAHLLPAGAGDLHGHALVDSWGGHPALISYVASWAALGGLFIHAFLDGAAIEASFSIHPTMGILVFFAVFIHKVPEGASLTSVLGAARWSNKAILVAAAGAALMTVVGGVATWAIGLAEPQGAYPLLALSAGTFLFIGASDLIPATQKGESRATVLAVLCGVGAFCLVSLILRITGIQH